MGSTLKEHTLFSIGEVAAMLGVSTHTIRAWERRYNVLTPGRNAAHQRQYRPNEVAMLLQVKQSVIAHGLSLKVAVKAARGELTVPGLVAVADGESCEQSASNRHEAAVRPPWQSVVDLMPQAILVMDRAGRIAKANAAAARVIGFPIDRIVGRLLVDFVAAEARQDADELTRAAFVAGRAFEVRLRRPRNGSQCWFDCRPFMYGHDIWIAVFADLTPPPADHFDGIRIVLR